MARRRRKPLPKELAEVEITDLTHEARGVAKLNDKVVFVDNALPGEIVRFKYTAVNRQYDEGIAVEIIKPSDKRVDPECTHFNMCGGCRLQHFDHAEQIKTKNKILVDNLQRIGNVQADELLEPVLGPEWAYRRKARLGVRYVHKKKNVLVGFRELGSGFIAELEKCLVLDADIGNRLIELGEMISKLSIYDAIPQLEVAAADNATAIIIRHLKPFTEDDLLILTDYAKSSGLFILLQPKGPKTIAPLWPEKQELFYSLVAEELKYKFSASDFIQVNREINEKLVVDVVDFLELEKEHDVLELFCGLGNFTLPIAKRVNSIVAVEGDMELVNKGRENALLNDIHNTEYFVANLMEDISKHVWLKKTKYDRLFIDPPRSGAQEIIPDLARLRIPLIVYVSCNPATLARDAGMLVNDFGYKLVKAGILDMFPHTAHVESIAVFKLV